jgi:cupin fold WbuC family metalloprotein
MQIIHKALLNHLSTQAIMSPRKRMNFNFHENAESLSQRMLNALEPGTVLPVHRHRHTAETYILLRGRIRVMYYDDAKRVTDSVVLDGVEGNFGLNIPLGQWHSLEVLEAGSVIFEAKDGPYSPLTEEDILL